MSTSLLLAFILAALLLQLGIGFGFGLRRRLRFMRATVPLTAGFAPHEPRGAWVGLRRFRVVRRVFEDPAQSQCSFRLAPVDGADLVPSAPGQYLTLALKLTGASASDAGRTILRCYSISAAPSAAEFRITVKRAERPAGKPNLPPGVATTMLLDRIADGDMLDVEAPAGRFIFDADAALSSVFIAGGIGIAPILCMLEAALAAPSTSHALHLYYGVANGADHAFKTRLGELAAAHEGFRQTVCYAAPRVEEKIGIDFDHAGFIDIALLRATLPAGRHLFYLCGPPGMMASLVPALRAWGVGEGDIRTESFGPSARGVEVPVAARPSVSFDVQFGIAGRTIAWDGRDANLLDFADRHGVALGSGCRTGACGACETRLVSGRVAYAHAPDHAVAAGMCLLCVAVPLCDLRLEG
ncbi:MAG: 2Fe-2S iron-sulfur cluster binding domain-containing protein [Telmatospirillum sp.]|nr:2Fe-2S iron-sulfur cluster binding domain-containing protein [Telmatospirillum sp.]